MTRHSMIAEEFSLKTSQLMRKAELLIRTTLRIEIEMNIDTAFTCDDFSRSRLSFFIVPVGGKSLGIEPNILVIVLPVRKLLTLNFLQMLSYQL